MGLFNRHENEDNRFKIMDEFKKELNIESEIPDNLEGIPTLTSINVSYVAFDEKLGENDIDTLWNLFETAIDYSKSDDERNYELFCELFDKSMKQFGTGPAKLTSALFRMRPYTYFNLDNNNINYISNEKQFDKEIFNIIKPLKKISGKQYLELCKEIIETIEKMENINIGYSKNSFKMSTH